MKLLHRDTASGRKFRPSDDTAGVLIVIRIRDCQPHPARYLRRHGIGDVVPRSAKASAAMYWGPTAMIKRSMDGLLFFRGGGNCTHVPLTTSRTPAPESMRMDWDCSRSISTSRSTSFEPSPDAGWSGGIKTASASRSKNGSRSGAGGGFGVGSGVSGWLGANHCAAPIACGFSPYGELAQRNPSR